MIEKQLEEYFESQKEKMLEDLFELIRIPSVCSNSEEGKPFGNMSAKGLEKALEISKQCGFSITNMGNYIGYADMNNSERYIDLLCHVDVVPATENWCITEPFNPVIKDGKVYGRGSADDKGPLIATLYAMKAIKDLNIPIKKNIRLVIGAAEEIGVRTELEYYYQKNSPAIYTISPDAEYPIVNIEKGSLRGELETHFEKTEQLPRIIRIKSGSTRSVIPGEAVVAIRGLDGSVFEKIVTQKEKEYGIKVCILSKTEDLIEFQVIGMATHAGAPEKGNNAVTAVIGLLCALPIAKTKGYIDLCNLYKIFPHGDWLGKTVGIARDTENSGHLHISLNYLDYSEDLLFCKFDSKLPVGCTEENTKKILFDKIIEQKIGVKKMELKPAHCVSLDSELASTLLKYYELYTGEKGYGITIDGETYVHNIENGVAFGCIMPGIDNNLHMADEFMEINMILKSAKIYARALIDLCSDK